MNIFLVCFSVFLLGAVLHILSCVGKDDYTPTFREALFLVISCLLMCCLAVVMAVVGIWMTVGKMP